MVLIKISEKQDSREALKERTRRAWLIKGERLLDQDKVMVVCKGEVLAVYNLLGYSKDSIEENRIAFELEEIESSLKGRIIETKTANPCTIIDESELVFKN